MLVHFHPNERGSFERPPDMLAVRSNVRTSKALEVEFGDPEAIWPSPARSSPASALAPAMHERADAELRKSTLLWGAGPISCCKGSWLSAKESGECSSRRCSFEIKAAPL